MMSNVGVGDARAVTINGITATNGVTLCDTCSASMALGDLGPGQSQPFTLKFDVPQGVSSFHTSFTGSAEDVCGNSYTYGS
jgi:hypothetical protein